MVSKQFIPVIGLKVTVYGLDEYNLLPPNTPVSVMFALHGRLRKCSQCRNELYFFLNLTL